jgi:hypothetical protein
MNQTPIRIMIDMETTSTDRRAGILSLGACVFGLPFGAPAYEFYERASLASNESLKRTIDRSTMEWWNKQDLEMRKEAFGGTQAVDDLLENFLKWVKDFRADPSYVEIWSRGAGFDCEILQDAFYQIFGSYPFDFRKHMCQRTVERLMPQSLKAAVITDPRKHHALVDAQNQARLMDVALRNLNWGGAY